jgi:zinc transport system ATP-binding protein
MNLQNDNKVRDPLIELVDISLKREYRKVLTDINITINRGDFVAITGPNGGGKTSLLRIILGLLKPTTGNVKYLINGNEVNSLPFGYLPQKNQIDSHFPITVREVIASGLLNCPDVSKVECQERVDGILKLIELEDFKNRHIGRLSGGQLQRTLLGRTLINNPKVLVLDEPLSYIDKHFESHLYKIINKLASDTTILLVSHEMSMISSMATRHLIIDNTLTECSAHHHYIRSECEIVNRWT